MSDDVLASARAAYEGRAWGDAYRRSVAADGRRGLDAEDLERLGTAAYLTGRAEEAAAAWGRAFRSFVDGGRGRRGARCAFWLGLTLMLRGEHARGGGWLARAQTALDESDCAELGYLRLPGALQALMGGDPGGALAEFEAISAVADRFDDPDLQALGRLGRGQALVAGGDAARGAGMLDEAMLAVTTGEVSAIAAGIVYCGVIRTCRDAFDLRRAQEWTAALNRWCDAQQDLQPYRGQCLVHRSEIMQLRGEWAEAMDEVRRACVHLADPPGDPVLGMALYQQAELLRLRGDYAEAEETYRRADRAGHPVQPGMALLRLAQGRTGDADAAIRRAVDETTGAPDRARVLAAYVEIRLAAGDVGAARTATEELAGIATAFDYPYLRAVVEYARGSVLLAAGDAASACAALRRSALSWRELGAPYEVGLVRLRMARACRDLDDHDTAALELGAARQAFTELGAAPALARTRDLAAPPDGLTRREVEVLRLVATGATNREIAASLLISEKTVARHLANMFTKLDVPSRAAATAYAYRHKLV